MAVAARGEKGARGGGGGGGGGGGRRRSTLRFPRLRLLQREEGEESSSTQRIVNSDENQQDCKTYGMLCVHDLEMKSMYL